MAGQKARVLIWHSRRAQRALTWPAAVAAGLLVLETAFYFSAVAPLLQERAKLRAEVMQRLQAAARSNESLRAEQDPRVELAQFYAALAGPAGVPDLLRKLHAAAREQGVRLDQAEYRPLPDPESANLTRYQILLPARGTYPEVRRFLVQAEARIPGLAIDSVNFQRQLIGEQDVDAQIRLTLFLGAPS